MMPIMPEIHWDITDPQGHGNLEVYGPKPPNDVVTEESFKVRGEMHFPKDVDAAATFTQLASADWKKRGRLTRQSQGSTVLNIVETATRDKYSKGYSAAMVGCELIRMSDQSLPISINKACFLVSEKTLKMGKVPLYGSDTRRSYGLLTGVDGIAKNFRAYRSVVHYWIMASAQTGGVVASDVYEESRVRFGFADIMRSKLLGIKGIGSKTWGMRRCPTDVKPIACRYSLWHSPENANYLASCKSPNYVIPTRGGVR